MPSWVDLNKCTGCPRVQEPLCAYICPSDIMVVPSGERVAINREPNMCWECYACAKVCPEEAIRIRGYADAIPLGASIQPHPRPQSIRWDIQFRDGTPKSFEYPTRTTPPGSIEPFADEPPKDVSRCPSQLLFGQREG